MMVTTKYIRMIELLSLKKSENLLMPILKRSYNAHTTSSYPNARLKLATVALGNGAIKQLSFYSSLHQQSLEKSFNQPKTNKQDPGNFDGSEWDLIRSNGDHFSVLESDMTTEETVDINGLMNEVDTFTSKIKLQIKQGDQQLVSGVIKFIKRYKQLSAYRSTARLASAFHQFGWVFGAATSRMNFKGNIDRYHMPTRNLPKGKRVRSLSMNIAKGVQNAGKW